MSKYSKPRVVAANAKISPLTIALLFNSGERLIVNFRHEGIVRYKILVNVLTTCMH